MSRFHHEIEENAVAALRHGDRVSEICIDSGSNTALEGIAEAMERPFPILTRLAIESTDQTAMVLPDSLLGGCALRPRLFQLQNVASSTLPKLLLSATGLVNLYLS
jgi:hypothetical protein